MKRKASRRMTLAASAAALALGACATATEAPALAAQSAAAAPAAVAPPPPPAPPAPPPNPQAQAFARDIDLGAGLHMLMGVGGNMGLLVGGDGVFLIDNQYVTNADANLAKIEQLAGKKPRYVINTHWHSDHAGGNAAMAGAGATVFAHENVRKRLSNELVSTGRAGQTEPRPKVAWPVVTFREGVDFHLNGQTVRAIKAPAPAHTDGDSLIHFVEADVLHMGDTYMKDRYPFVDTGSGGTQAGFIAALKLALTIADADTRIIPGHGELANRADLEAALAMHEGARKAVETLVKQGKTLEQAVAAKPLAPWNARFLSTPGAFINDDAYVTVIYNELKAKK